jgi:capsular polysaccharide transport system permease protein
MPLTAPLKSGLGIYAQKGWSVTEQAALGPLANGARVQARVLGALIIRELHTRFGRENIGYLWFIVEPLLLAVGITLIQSSAHVALPEGLDPVAFHTIGYISFMMFRSNVTRASVTVLSNRVLMYHKQVTMFDLLLARSILELAATSAALIILLSFGAWLGFGHAPERPLLMIVGMLTMAWFTTGLAMIICAAGEFSSTVERLIHPITYLSLPVSGMLFRLEWLPANVRDVLRWVPTPQIIDIIRMGMWERLESDYVDPLYLVAVCSGLTLIGLLALNIARDRVEFE